MSARNFNIYGKVTRFGNITILKGDNNIGVQLHNTVVASKNLNTGEITLNTGGWQTATTKTAMNTALEQFQVNAKVFVDAGVWYVKFNGQTLFFSDNMKLGQ